MPEPPKRFAYYDSLSTESRRTYRKSDRLLRVDFGDPAELSALARAVEPPLAAGDREGAERASQALVDALNARLAAPAVRVIVLERRPSDSSGELQGLYEPDDVTGGIARITVWMRTARKEQVVRFRTFLRTVLHEVMHHLDYEHFKLAETFHTQGFYARESALLRDLIGPS